MDNSSVALATPSKSVGKTIEVIIPTLGRPSLQKTLQSLKDQTVKVKVILKNDDKRDTLIKIKEGLNEAKGTLVAICDDDAEYPPNWIELLSKQFGEHEKIGSANGSALPLLDESSNNIEKTIGEITSNFFGTTNMSYRFKASGQTEERDETNLIGNGVYDRKLLTKIFNEDYHKIPPAAWETYVFTRIRELGYHTMYVHEASFYHRQRRSVFSFAKQIFRCGEGRMNYFKIYKASIFKKYFMLVPTAFTLYLILYILLQILVHTFNIPIPIYGVIPILSYVILDGLVCQFKIKENKGLAFLLFFIMHASYGLGMIRGFFEVRKTWN